LDGVRFFERPRTALGVLAQTFIAVERIVSNQERANADVQIVPKVGHIRWDQTRRAKDLIECGYQAGLGAIEEIRSVMNKAASIDDDRVRESVVV
jgi:predicted acylesterase/phospholipase RssA